MARMEGIRITAVLLLFLIVSRSWSSNGSYSIDDVQGGWWASCEEPAVEFYVSGNEYSGDFMGNHPLEVKGDLLTFKKGLIDGHSISVTGIPLSFRILEANGVRLVLEPQSKENRSPNWTLYKCN